MLCKLVHTAHPYACEQQFRIQRALSRVGFCRCPISAHNVHLHAYFNRPVEKWGTAKARRGDAKPRAAHSHSWAVTREDEHHRDTFATPPFLFAPTGGRISLRVSARSRRLRAGPAHRCAGPFLLVDRLTALYDVLTIASLG